MLEQKARTQQASWRMADLAACAARTFPALKFFKSEAFDANSHESRQNDNSYLSAGASSNTTVGAGNLGLDLELNQFVYCSFKEMGRRPIRGEQISR